MAKFLLVNKEWRFSRETGGRALESERGVAVGKLIKGGKRKDIIGIKVGFHSTCFLLEIK